MLQTKMAPSSMVLRPYVWAYCMWDQEPWSMGAAAYYAPGEMTTMFPHVAGAEGRVHFAGEHTSTLFVMEGAAQSGVRVAREIGAPI